MSALKVTKNNFENEVLKSDKPVLVDFFATWCGPCKMMSPIVDQIADENPQYKVCKVNVDEEPELAQKYGVVSIPMFVVIRDGVVDDTLVGGRPKAQLLELLEG